MRGVFGTIFRLFLTGLATLMPLVVTVLVLGWIVRLADSYIGPSSAFGIFLVTISGKTDPFPGYVVGYVVVALLIMLLGFLVTRATVARIQEAVDSMVARIPLVGKIYSAVGQVVELLSSKEGSGLARFGGVAHVQMGNVRILALLTSSQRYILPDGREYLLVFVPYSPIPITGFNILAPVEDVTPLDMPIEDLAKLFMSLGVLAPQVLPKPMARISTARGEDG